jgi:hypothetical protein
MRIRLFKLTIKGNNESGFEIPNNKPISFNKSPDKNRKEMLSPTEKRRISTPSSSSNLSSLRITKPGTNVKEMNPNTCLATGTSKNTVMHTISCKNNIASRKFLDFHSINMGFICLEHLFSIF